MNFEDEAVQTVKLAEYIKLKIEEEDYSFSSQKSKDAYIQETFHSKERWCQECYYRRKKVEEENLEYVLTTNEKQALEPKEFQLEEYKRRNKKPISKGKRKRTSSASSSRDGTNVAEDVERYITSLPDRSNILKNELGYDKSNPDSNPDDSIDLENYIYNLQITIWVIFSSDNADVLAQRIEDADVLEIGEDFSAKDINRIRRKVRTGFIKDKNRIFPNEQEITAYLKRYQDYSDAAEAGFGFTIIYSSFKIQYCKIFNLGLDKNNNEKFKIIVHFSHPKGYWIEVDIPDSVNYRSISMSCLAYDIHIPVNTRKKGK
jgi:hypothetical protein